MADELIQPSGYGDFLREVKAQIRERQYQALRAANKELLALYWWLGQGGGGDAGARPASRVSGAQRVFGPKPVVDAAVLQRIRYQTKTPTTGWRNQLGHFRGWVMASSNILCKRRLHKQLARELP